MLYLNCVFANHKKGTGVLHARTVPALFGRKIQGGSYRRYRITVTRLTRPIYFYFIQVSVLHWL